MVVGQGVVGRGSRLKVQACVAALAEVEAVGSQWKKPLSSKACQNAWWMQGGGRRSGSSWGRNVSWVAVGRRGGENSSLWARLQRQSQGRVVSAARPGGGGAEKTSCP